MNPLITTLYVLFVGLIMSSIPMFFQSMALKLEATVDNRKFRLSKEIRRAASLLIGFGAGGLAVITIIMVVTPFLKPDF